ncbi:odorant receptor Or1 [Monomorium pharaonis]|uniref:odorant receptor Or1 n=1 Tax=Monomorium pharaonis TaxID=307658 RepID=UPI00063F01BA|nr:odorant receptor Or1 [Monomorium pharaonis]
MTRGTTTGRSLEQFRKLSALHLTYLKYIGLWAEFDSNSSRFLRYLYHVYNKFILAVILVFMVTLFADICLSFDDLSIVTDDGCIFAGIVVVFFKVMIFQTRREQIVRLLHETIDGCNRLCKFPIGDEGEIVDKYLLISRVTFYGFSTLAFFLVISLLFVVPVEDGELPIRARYPFNTTVYPWHGIGFFVEACTVSVGLTAIIGIDSLLTNLCNLFLVQLEILNTHFKNCGNDRQHDATPNGIDKRDNSGTTSRNVCYEVSLTFEANCGKDNYVPDAIRRGDFSVRFGRSIRNHQRLLAVICDFNKIFSAGMFVQIVSSTSMICLTGFQAVLVIGQNSNILKFMVYLMAALSQLFYFCWIGNEVLYQSALLTQNQWLSKWDEELSAKTGRLLILSLIFSKKAVKLKAGVFFALSMETYTSILKGSYSFFALLSTMHLEDDQ